MAATILSFCHWTICGKVVLKIWLPLSGSGYTKCVFVNLQDSGREASKVVPMSPEAGEGDDAESPMPHPSQISQAVRRRGAISAEPITEEDVATYVKKVCRQWFDNV